MNGGLTLATHIDINKVALLDLERLLFHRQRSHPALTEGDATLHQRTNIAARGLRRTLDGTEVHDSLVVFRGER